MGRRRGPVHGQRTQQELFRFYCKITHPSTVGANTMWPHSRCTVGTA